LQPVARRVSASQPLGNLDDVTRYGIAKWLSGSRLLRPLQIDSRSVQEQDEWLKAGTKRGEEILERSIGHEGQRPDDIIWFRS
jgi:hypothetical protein